MALIYAVEDDKNILEIEMFALKNSGYQVEGFECAHDFYKKLEEKQPDLVLLDIMLPEEDGLSILRRLRASPRTEHLPVMMLTARSSEYDKVIGLDGGADDYLTKPFGMMELIARSAAPGGVRPRAPRDAALRGHRVRHHHAHHARLRRGADAHAEGIRAAAPDAGASDAGLYA